MNGGNGGCWDFEDDVVDVTDGASLLMLHDSQGWPKRGEFSREFRCSTALNDNPGSVPVHRVHNHTEKNH